MEYLIILALQLIGIGLHVGQKVNELDKLLPDDTLGDVFTQFWKTDKITIFIQVFIIALNEIGHYIIHEYAPDSIADWQYLDLTSFGVALILGYGGQNLVYRALGKSIDFANKKIDEKLQ